MIARLSEAMGTALVGNNFQLIPWKFHVQRKKNLLSLPDIYKALNLLNCRTGSLHQGQYRNSSSTFSSSEPVVALSDCSRLGNALCLCLPILPAQPVLERCPKSLAIDFAVKSFDCLLEQPSGVTGTSRHWL